MRHLGFGPVALAALMLLLCVFQSSADPNATTRSTRAVKLPPRIDLTGGLWITHQGGREVINLDGLREYIAEQGDVGLLVGLCDERPLVTSEQALAAPAEADLQVRDAFTNWYTYERSKVLRWRPEMSTQERRELNRAVIQELIRDEGDSARREAVRKH